MGKQQKAKPKREEAQPANKSRTAPEAGKKYSIQRLDEGVWSEPFIQTFDVARKKIMAAVRGEYPIGAVKVRRVR